MAINESVVERRLVDKLEDVGFMVLKLITPGYMGTMDRLILWPKYAPGLPMFLELKRPRAKLRPLQAARAADWQKRGAIVLRPCHTIEEVDQLCHDLIQVAMKTYDPRKVL
jgi:hypothetical protein